MLQIATPVFSQERSNVQDDTIAVVGSVNRPGKYTVGQSGTITVGTAIAQAGGVEANSDQNAYVYRRDDQGVKHEIRISLGNILNRQGTDFTLYRGDILFVPITGKKAAPKAITLPDHDVAGI